MYILVLVSHCFILVAYYHWFTHFLDPDCVGADAREK